MSRADDIQRIVVVATGGGLSDAQTHELRTFADMLAKVAAYRATARVLDTSASAMAMRCVCTTTTVCAFCRKYGGVDRCDEGHCTGHPTPLKDNVPRCKVCNWPLAASVAEGCVEGNCSYRPHAKGNP